MRSILFVRRTAFETHHIKLCGLCLFSLMGHPSFDPSSFLIDGFNVLHRLLLCSYLCVEAIEELGVLFCQCTVNFQASVCPASHPRTVVQIGV